MDTCAEAFPSALTSVQNTKVTNTTALRFCCRILPFNEFMALCVLKMNICIRMLCTEVGMIISTNSLRFIVTLGVQFAFRRVLRITDSRRLPSEVAAAVPDRSSDCPAPFETQKQLFKGLHDYLMTYSWFACKRASFGKVSSSILWASA